jgi:hypothetical protein
MRGSSSGPSSPETYAAASGSFGPAVGIVTFDTETGDWTVITRNRLPHADANIYYPSISTSPASTYPGVGRWVQETYPWDYVWSVDGRIEATGTVDSEELARSNEALANGGIFVLATNFI